MNDKSITKRNYKLAAVLLLVFVVILIISMVLTHAVTVGF